MENNEMLELLIGEVKLTGMEEEVYRWKDLLTGEEEDLTDEEKKAWEVRK